MTGLVTFPFPLDSGVLAYLNLPVDLSRHEAERLGAMLKTLPIPDSEEPPRWPETGC